VSKVGKFLVARPAINSGFFKKSVVFIYEDTENGTVGLNLSTPSNLTLRAVDPQKTVDYPYPDPVLYLGGPVNDRAVMMLHSDDFVSVNTLFTDSGLNVSSDDLMVEKMFSGDWPRLFRLTVGASVWAPGQLDYEINQNLWLVSDLDYSSVFELSGDDLWNWAIEFIGSKTMARYF
jgi:putative transcriptional regulator